MNRLRMGLLLVMASIALAPREAPAQRTAKASTGWDTATFVAEARSGTRRYESQQTAIDDGFIRVGVEFPAMGEHWVSFARVLEDSLAPHRPSVLIYSNVNGSPRLGGVAYTKLLTGQGTPPSFPSRAAWHEHSGAVDEESLPLGHSGHDMPGRPGSPDDSPRLFILHAWIWEANPDGTFVTDNWSLPFTRLGIPRGSARRDAIRAIALESDADEYHRLVLRTTLRLSRGEDAAVARVIAAHQFRAEQEMHAIRRDRRLTPASMGRLETIWASLWVELATALPQRVNELQRLRSQM